MEQQSLLCSILQEPEDDTRRLIYADWLEERGDPRAEFVRVQCALARAQVAGPPLQILLTRERELLTVHGQNWCAALGLDLKQCVFRRGFVESVEIDADQFLECSEALFNATPLQQVHLLNATGRIGELSGCPRLGKLEALDLSGNAVRDPEIALLAASPHLSRLNALDLSGCALHREAAEHLAGGGLRRLRSLKLAGTEIGPEGLVALLRSATLGHLTYLDVRGNHQCWVSPNQGEPWMTLTEVNVKDEGVRSFAAAPEAARLKFVDLSLNNIEPGGWDALTESPHFSATLCLNVFESDHVYRQEGPPGDSALPYTINEEISDVLCVALPGYGRRPIARIPGDPRWTAPPCTIGVETVRRLRDRFGQRIEFMPPTVRFGALFSGTRADWFGRSAPLDFSIV